MAIRLRVKAFDRIWNRRRQNLLLLLPILFLAFNHFFESLNSLKTYFPTDDLKVFSQVSPERRRKKNGKRIQARLIRNNLPLNGFKADGTDVFYKCFEDKPFRSGKGIHRETLLGASFFG